MKRISGVNRRRSRSYLAIGTLIIVISLLFSAVPVSALAQSLYRYEPSAPVNPVSMISPHLLWQYNVLVALNPSDCADPQAGITLQGNGTTTIYGGGALSYGCLRGLGNAGAVEIEPPFKPLGRDISPGNMTWNPVPEYYRTLIELLIDFTNQAEQACNELPRFGQDYYQLNSETIISPGNYPSILVTDTLTMLPGLYCLTGDFAAGNGAIVNGQDVTIYMSKGDFTANPSAEMHLTAPKDGVVNEPLWQDLLLYVGNSHTATVSILGNAASDYRGVVYAPASNINISGVGQLHLQLVGWNIKVGGTNDIDLSVDFWPGLPNMEPGRN